MIFVWFQKKIKFTFIWGIFLRRGAASAGHGIQLIMSSATNVVKLLKRKKSKHADIVMKVID